MGGGKLEFEVKCANGDSTDNTPSRSRSQCAFVLSISLAGTIGVQAPKKHKAGGQIKVATPAGGEIHVVAPDGVKPQQWFAAELPLQEALPP